MTLTSNTARENLWREFTDIVRTIHTLRRTLKLADTPHLQDFLNKQVAAANAKKAEIEAKLIA